MPTIEQKLAALGVAEQNLTSNAQILSRSSTTGDLELEFKSRRFSCDVEQFIMPPFRKLYVGSPDVRDQVIQDLNECGIKPEIIDEYFTELSDQPYLVFNFKYEDEIPLEIRVRFNEMATQVAFRTLKAYLEEN
jgi:hypothetical protein